MSLPQAGGEIDMFLKNSDFVAAILVESDFTDSKNCWAIDEFGNDRQDFIRQFYIFRFLWVNAQPGVMLQAKFGGTLRFKISQLAEVIVKATR